AFPRGNGLARVSAEDRHAAPPAGAQGAQHPPAAGLLDPLPDLDAAAARVRVLVRRRKPRLPQEGGGVMFKRKNKRPPRLEVQVITVIGLVLAALCIVSAYSPTVEATL